MLQGPMNPPFRKSVLSRCCNLRHHECHVARNVQTRREFAGKKTVKPRAQSGRVGGGLMTRWAFIASIPAGLAAGLAGVPATAYRLDTALLTIGAFCIAAFATRDALHAQNRTEELQQRLLDERSYHAFVDSS